MVKGSVYKSMGSRYIVKISSGEFLECFIKGKLRTKNIRSTNPIAVGDDVDCEIEETGGNKFGIIKEVLPRRNYIIRKSVNLSKETHIIASNIDQVFLVISLYKPETTTIFIDRFLLTANSFDIPCVLVFNKIDLYGKRHLEHLEHLKNLYRSLGYDCIKSSVLKKMGIDEIGLKMKGKTSLLSGHSGVGKSSLINAIEPRLKLKTTEISEQYSTGQHTTTFAERIDLSFGGSIIDSPGIKGFGIVKIEKNEVGRFFPEIFANSKDCKYYNCTHIKEPHCNVKEALKEGKIAPSRYQNYLQIVSNEDDKHRLGISS